MEATNNNFKKVSVNLKEKSHTVYINKMAKDLHDTRDDMSKHLDVMSEYADIISNFFVNLSENSFMSMIGTMVDEYCHHNNVDYDKGNEYLRSIIEVRETLGAILADMPYTDYPKFD